MFKSEIVNVAKKITDFKSSEQFDGYSRVTIDISEDTRYTSGTDTGRALTAFCPWATQEIADDILQDIKGYQYQPFKAFNALLNPAAELGDGISVNGVYGGIYTLETDFNSLYTANVSAPADEEIEHEYKYESKHERKVKREIHGLTSELRIQADKISAEVSERKSDVDSIKSTLSVQSDSIKAKVSKTGGSQSTFGWELLSTEWRIFAGTKNVLKATKDGLDITGKVTALSGKIGGFDILKDRLSYNNAEWGGTNTEAIYLGTRGLQLGGVNTGFSVDNRGRMRAESGEFRGTVRAGKILYGGDDGYFSGSGLARGSVHGGNGGAIGGGSISTFNTSGGINGSLANADYANSVVNGWNQAPYINCLDFKVFRDMYYGSNKIKLLTRNVMGENGKPIRINYLGVL